MTAARAEADALLEGLYDALDQATDALDTIVGSLSYDELTTLRARVAELATCADDDYESVAELAEATGGASLWDDADRAYEIAVAIGGHASAVIGLVDGEIDTRDWHTETE